MSDPSSQAVGQRDIEVAFTPKNPIKCIQSTKDSVNLEQSPSLIFTHGAGGTLKADAVANFAQGFAAHLPITCFQGNMNLKSRVKMFSAVCENQKSLKCLGGRSMGARAAVMAATANTTHLVLVSYPLHAGKEVRDKILLDLSEDINVLFISGDNDNMCDIERLDNVRKKMKCRSWLCVVKGADHGMNVKPKSATAEIVQQTGEIAASWLQQCEDSTSCTTLSWNAETGVTELQASQGNTTIADKQRKRPHLEDHEKATTSERKRRK